MKTNVRTDKLRILAHHLLYEELAHEFFDFRVVDDGKKFRLIKGFWCGSNGCAMGEMPFVFNDVYPDQISKIHVATYFQMTLPQVLCLFFSSPYEFCLPPSSAKEEVANRILWLCDTIERVNEQASMSTFTYVESENVEVREEEEVSETLR